MHCKKRYQSAVHHVML